MEIKWEKKSRIDILVADDLLAQKSITVGVLREDLLDPYLSGNKFRKLRFFVERAIQDNKHSLLSFGGAYSNHLYALAYAGKLVGLPTIGYVRGEEWADKITGNTTLAELSNLGMSLFFINRIDYKKKYESSFLEEIQKKHPSAFIIPEGGNNELGFYGCREILYNDTRYFNWVCTAIGTGVTCAGIVDQLSGNQKCMGFPAIKQGEYLEKEIHKYTSIKNLKLNHDYHFGGFGKTNDSLINFMNSFYKKHRIPLDPIYTGKMFYGIFDLIKKNFFSPGTKILLVHTGGLQGIKGMNEYLKRQQRTTINYRK